MNLYDKLNIKKNKIESILVEGRTICLVENYDSGKRKSYITPCSDGFRVVQRIKNSRRTPKMKDVKTMNVYCCDHKHVWYLRSKACKVGILDERNSNRVARIEKGN